MTNKEIKISYEEYSSCDEMTEEDRNLVNKAIEARSGSYSPYSKFQVGAAVRLADGRIFTGANQENAAYPSGLCAERTAMFYAHSHNDGSPIVSIAIAGGFGDTLCDSPATPCGNCRQVMAEFEKEGGVPISVILAGGRKNLKFPSVEALLPFIFDSL